VVGVFPAEHGTIAQLVAEIGAVDDPGAAVLDSAALEYVEVELPRAAVATVARAAVARSLALFVDVADGHALGVAVAGALAGVAIPAARLAGLALRRSAAERRSQG
jgi:hypothetical protein